MGTSSNIPSPRVPRWSAVLAAIGNEAVPPERQSREIWSAARQEWGDALVEAVSALGPALASIASEAGSPGKALSQLDDRTAEGKLVGIAVDLAPAALARCVANGTRAPQVVAELFAEIADYYASRDLPSVVGRADRVQTPAAALVLKDRLKDVARKAVKDEGGLPVTADRWSEFVRRIVDHLAEVKP